MHPYLVWFLSESWYKWLVFESPMFLDSYIFYACHFQFQIPCINAYDQCVTKRCLQSLYESIWSLWMLQILIHAYVTLSHWFHHTHIYIYIYVWLSPWIRMHTELLRTLLFWLIGFIHIHIKEYQIFYIFCHVIIPFTLELIVYHTLFWLN